MLKNMVCVHLLTQPTLGPTALNPFLFWQEHKAFYDSALQMTNQPRQLQHLARCTMRKYLGARCHSVIPRLNLPLALRDYLCLPLEGYIR